MKKRYFDDLKDGEQLHCQPVVMTREAIIDFGKNNAMREAKEIVTKNNLKAYLRPALQTLSNDTFEIAKVTTPILLGLVAGGIQFPQPSGKTETLQYPC